jgi:hypothetical protein
VADRHGGIAVEQQVRGRLAPDRGSTDHHGVAAAQRDVVVLEQRDDRVCGGRREGG